MFIIGMVGSAVSTTLGPGSMLELQVLTTMVHNVRSSCCFMEDAVPTGRATSGAGEDGEASPVTTATVTVWFGTDESVATVS